MTMVGHEWQGHNIRNQGVTIRNLLDKVDQATVVTQGGVELKAGNMDNRGQHKMEAQSTDPPSAYLGPKLWEKSISLDLDERNMMGDVMNIEEFLRENNLKVDGSFDEKAVKIEDPPTSPCSVSSVPVPHRSDIKTQSRPSIIVAPKSPRFQNIPEDDKTFLYSESKRAKVEREKEELKKRLEVEFPEEDLALATVPGHSFDPKVRAFDMEELRPQPIIRKRSKNFVPDESKDGNYWDKRSKNNQAARRSREARRLKENQIALRAAFLEKENKGLRKDLENSHFENTKLSTEREILMMKLDKYEKFAAQ